MHKIVLEALLKYQFSTRFCGMHGNSELMLGFHYGIRNRRTHKAYDTAPAHCATSTSRFSSSSYCWAIDCSAHEYRPEAFVWGTDRWLSSVLRVKHLNFNIRFVRLSMTPNGRLMAIIVARSTQQFCTVPPGPTGCGNGKRLQVRNNKWTSTTGHVHLSLFPYTRAYPPAYTANRLAVCLCCGEGMFHFLQDLNKSHRTKLRVQAPGADRSPCGTSPADSPARPTETENVRTVLKTSSLATPRSSPNPYTPSACLHGVFASSGEGLSH